MDKNTGFCYLVVFNFFNYIIRIKSNDDKLLAQIKYIYKEYICNESIKSHYLYLIQNNSTSTFLLSELMDSKDIIVYHGQDEDSLVQWKESVTFLPPITAPYFRKHLSFYHGCSIRYKEITIAFFGASRSGKTNMIMELLDDGGELISDDIVIIRNSDYSVIPFKKPIGIRNTGRFFTDSRIVKAIENKPIFMPTFYVNELDLVTELIHLSEIPGWNYYDIIRSIDQIFIIDNVNEPEEYTLYKYVEALSSQACISDNGLKVLLEIYKNLKSKPRSINMRKNGLLPL